MKLNKYKMRRKNSLSENTLDSRLYILRNFESFLDGMGVDEPDTESVHQYIDFLQEEDYNNGTIQQYFYHIRDYCSIMSIDIDEDSISRRLPSYTPERKDILTKKEVRTIIQDDVYKRPTRTIGFLLYSFARRLDEVRPMTTDQIDLDEGTIEFKILKSNIGYKEFEMDDAVYSRVKRWYEDYRENGSDYLFPGTTSKIIGYSTVSVAFKRLCKEHGIGDKYNTHHLRHSRISHLKSNGIPFHVIRDELSFHQSLSVLQDTYTHATEEDKESIPSISQSLKEVK